jgi:ParB family chromosome partitioning protein
MVKVGGLGRGLSSLIPNKKLAEGTVTKENEALLGVFDQNKILQIPVENIEVNPMQPRQVFDHDKLEELINSIKEYGIIQPIIVTKQGSAYELIAGERRLRSAKILNLKTVPAIVRQADEQQKLELALIENVQRKNLNPVEEALAFQKLIDEFNLTQEEAAKKLGKSRSVIANTIRILSLPAPVQKALVDNKITEGHARVIAGFETEEEQLKFLEQILNYNFTVRDAEKESRKFTKHKVSRKIVNPVIEEYKDKLRQNLGTKVEIKKIGKQGQLVISFYSDEELSEIVGKIVKDKI